MGTAATAATHHRRTTRPMKNLASIAVCLFSTLLATAPAGCTTGGAAWVTPEVEVIDKTSQAIMLQTPKWVNGTYGAECMGRSGAWSARISGSGSMTNPSLSVIMNDSACVLSITSLVLLDDYTYDAAAPLALAGDFAETGTSFARASLPVAFQANAKISEPSFGDYFRITISLSDPPRLTTGSTAPTYATVGVWSPIASNVTAPDYGVDLGDLMIQKDAQNEIVDVSGALYLSAGARTGEHWVVSTDPSLGTTFGDVDAAYQAGTPQPLEDDYITAGALSLGGASLPTTRSVIIAHIEDGVAAYQVIQLSFTLPN